MLYSSLDDLVHHVKEKVVQELRDMVVEKKAGEQEMRVFLHNFLAIKISNIYIIK